MKHLRFAAFFLALVTLCHVRRISAFSRVVQLSAVEKRAPTAVGVLSRSPRHAISHSAALVTCSMTSSSDDDDDSVKSWPPLERPILAALDFAAILGFAFVGTSSHNSASDYVDVVMVALPFLISWFVLTPFLGLYEQDATSDKIGALSTTAKGWIVAIPMGCVLRGLIKGYVPPVPFMVVTMIATLVILGGTRVAYTAVRN